MYFRWRKQDLISIGAKLSHHVGIVCSVMQTLEVLCVFSSYRFWGVMLFREQCIHSYVFLQASCLKVVLLEHKMRARTEIIMLEVSVVSLPKYSSGVFCSDQLQYAISRYPFRLFCGTSTILTDFRGFT